MELFHTHEPFPLVHFFKGHGAFTCLWNFSMFRELYNIPGVFPLLRNFSRLQNFSKLRKLFHAHGTFLQPCNYMYIQLSYLQTLPHLWSFFRIMEVFNPHETLPEWCKFPMVIELFQAHGDFPGSWNIYFIIHQ